MAVFQKVVTPVSQISQSELPPEFIAYALIVTPLNETGVLDQIAERLKLDRNKGYQGIDLVLVLLAFFCARLKVGGLRKFVDKLVPRFRGRLAALGGRLKFPTQGSLSRMLSAVEQEQATDVSRFMLHESVDYAPLLDHSSVKYLDRKKQAWDLFDFDITATALRQRGVAEGDDLPEVKRLSERVGAPGRTGRKRGHIKLSRATIQHRGCRLWVDAQMAKGNGNWPELVSEGFEQAEQFASHQGLDPNRCIMCIDGEMGGHPQVHCGLDSPFSFVTRLAMYSPLNKEVVQRRLNQQHWQEVSDSGTGPRRQATEYGTLELGDGRSARLVVTRFRASRKRGAGACIDGWLYEVFATDVPREAFTAADVAWIYFGRCGQENYFSLEDRELELDHLFSTNLAGQHLANVVGLWLWNLELLHGVWAHGGLPAVEHKPELRPQAPLFDDSSDQEVLIVESNPLTTSVDTLDIEQSFLAFDWASYFADRPDFNWSRELGCPTCVTGEPLEVHGVRRAPSGNLEVRFRIRKGPCQGCPKRGECTGSTDPMYRKEITVTVPLVDEDVNVPKNNSVRRLRWISAQPVTEMPSQFEPRAPVLSAQKLRHQFEECCITSSAQLEVTLPLSRPEPPKIYAMTAEQRHRRRRTWSQRIGWNSLDKRTRLTLTLVASPELQRYLTFLPPNPGSSALNAEMG